MFFRGIFHPINYLRPAFLSLKVVTQIRGHMGTKQALILPPHSPLRIVRALHFYRKKTSDPLSTRIKLYTPTLGFFLRFCTYFAFYLFILFHNVTTGWDSNSIATWYALPEYIRGYDILYNVMTTKSFLSAQNSVS